MTSTDTDTDDGHMWCFQCGNSYDADVAECVECGVATTSAKPEQAEGVGESSEPQLAYEFHEWSGQGRSILDGMLTRSAIAHAWQGATLIVREVDEGVVDAAVSETEIVAMPTLDLNEPTMVYELQELETEQHGRLLRRLSQNGISHAFDRKGDLFVYEKDEEQVDELFDTLDQIDPAERQFGRGVAGVDPVDIMSRLFLAAGRLKKKPTDAKGVVNMVETTAIVEQMKLPYGFTGEAWAPVVDVASDLAAVLRGESDLVEGTVEEMAEQLHNMLRAMV